MTVPEFYIRLWMMVFLHLGIDCQGVDAPFWIIPSKLQVLEYNSLSFQCLGSADMTEWKVMRKARANISACGSARWGALDKLSCTIKDAFLEDSGEYWCEAEGGGRSNSVNIAVSVSVILESPVHPVMEGQSVMLRCRSKVTSTNFTTEFYKNGLSIGRSETREMTIHGVLVSDKGFYKCRIGDESPESWLAVTAQHQHSHGSVDVVFLVFRDVLPVVMMVLILLLLAELNGWKCRASRCKTVKWFDCGKIFKASQK